MVTVFSNSLIQSMDKLLTTYTSINIPYLDRRYTKLATFSSEWYFTLPNT